MPPVAGEARHCLHDGTHNARHLSSQLFRAQLLLSLFEDALVFQLLLIGVGIEDGLMIRALVAITVRHGPSSGSRPKKADDSNEAEGSSTRIVKAGAYATASSSSTLSSTFEKRRDTDANGPRSVRKSISAFVLGGKLAS